VHYEEMSCSSATNRVQGMPFRWSLNPYKGCVHGCHYCCARRYHSFLDLAEPARPRHLGFNRAQSGSIIGMVCRSIAMRRSETASARACSAPASKAAAESR